MTPVAGRVRQAMFRAHTTGTNVRCRPETEQVIANDHRSFPPTDPRQPGRRPRRPGTGETGSVAAAGQSRAQRRLRTTRRPLRVAGPGVRTAVPAQPGV